MIQTKSKHGEQVTARCIGQPATRTITRTLRELRWFKDLNIKVKKTYRVATTLTFTVDVPVLVTTVPEVPDAIHVGKHVFVKSQEAPLTYRWVSIWKATKRNDTPLLH
jgi:hypothetical protein